MNELSFTHIDIIVMEILSNSIISESQMFS